LSTGFNLVTWTGASGIPIVDALAPLGGALEIAFTYDELAARFLTYGPGLVSFLNTAEALAYGEALWVQLTRPTTWDQPAPPPGSVFGSADGRATVTIPVGSTADLTVTAIPEDDWPSDIDGQTVLAGYTVTTSPQP